MLYTVKHRCVGYPNDKPAEYTIEANSPEEAEANFAEAYVDLNYFIVSVTPNIACTGRKANGRVSSSETYVALRQ